MTAPTLRKAVVRVKSGNTRKVIWTLLIGACRESVLASFKNMNAQEKILNLGY